jgi:hypothetical protein
MAWLDCFKLGDAGSEIEFANNPSEVTFEDVEICDTDRNLAGDKKKYFSKVGHKISLKYPMCEIAELNKLQSIKNAYGTFKRLLMNDALGIIDEPRISSDKDTVTIMPSSRAGITITGVWLYTDTGHTGTNYYTGGSYNATTKTITLGTSLPASNMAVIINYSYQGWDVDIIGMPTVASVERPLTFDVQIELEGI